jgi:hypothetical protein
MVDLPSFLDQLFDDLDPRCAGELAKLTEALVGPPLAWSSKGDVDGYGQLRSVPSLQRALVARELSFEIRDERIKVQLKLV